MANTKGTNDSLATRIQSGTLNKSEFKTVVDSFQKEIASALPVHLKKNAEKYARQALSLFSANPRLQQCRPVTILSALMTASALGLDLNPVLGQAYILPYQNKGVHEAQFQLGYKGIIALAYRSGQIARIMAEVVRERDQFEYSKGLRPKLEHVESDEEERGEITHVYALANLVNGGYIYDVWPVAKVVSHAKRFSRAYGSGPWKTDFESMAKKTLIMAIWKYLPVSTELAMAAANDGTTKDDLAAVQAESDVLDIPFTPVPDGSSEPEPLPAEREPGEEG
ncbi:MAG: recombinase RecT [Clostridia bacterium]|nr:recombinase RecT [Clostridia bacterium]